MEMCRKSDSTNFFTVDKASITLNNFNKIGKRRACFVD